jgi:hypothetical protein
MESIILADRTSVDIYITDNLVVLFNKVSEERVLIWKIICKDGIQSYKTAQRSSEGCKIA